MKTSVTQQQFWLIMISNLLNPMAFDMFYWSGEHVVQWIGDLYQSSVQDGYNFFNIMGTAYIFGVFISQIFWSVAFGYRNRRWPFITGMIVVILGSSMGIVSNDWAVQIVARGIIGSGIACAITAVTIIIAEWYRGNIKKLNYGYSAITVVSLMGSLFAPFLTIFLMGLHGSWKVIYMLLLLFSLLMTVGIFLLIPKYTRVRGPRHQQFLISRGLIYEIALNVKMLQQIIINGLCFGNITIYYTSAVLIFVYTLHASSHAFGLLMTANIVGAMLGSIVNSRCRSSRDLQRILRHAIHVSLACAVGLIMLDHWTGLTIFTTELLLFLFSVCCGIVMANSTTGFILASKKYISISIGLYNILRFGFALLASAMLIPMFNTFQLQGILYLVFIFTILQTIAVNTFPGPYSGDDHGE